MAVTGRRPDAQGAEGGADLAASESRSAQQRHSAARRHRVCSTAQSAAFTLNNAQPLIRGRSSHVICSSSCLMPAPLSLSLTIPFSPFRIDPLDLSHIPANLPRWADSAPVIRGHGGEHHSPPEPDRREPLQYQDDSWRLAKSAAAGIYAIAIIIPYLPIFTLQRRGRRYSARWPGRWLALRRHDVFILAAPVLAGMFFHSSNQRDGLFSPDTAQSPARP